MFQSDCPRTDIFTLLLGKTRKQAEWPPVQRTPYRHGSDHSLKVCRPCLPVRTQNSRKRRKILWSTWLWYRQTSVLSRNELITNNWQYQCHSQEIRFSWYFRCSRVIRFCLYHRKTLIAKKTLKSTKSISNDNWKSTTKKTWFSLDPTALWLSLEISGITEREKENEWTWNKIKQTEIRWFTTQWSGSLRP